MQQIKSSFACVVACLPPTTQ